jgi:restriction endonuclease S subunit
MAVWSIINKSEIEGSSRIDAEYYQPEYLTAHRDLLQLNVSILNSFCSYIKKGIFDLSPDSYRDQGVPFIRTTEIKKEVADLDSAVFIPKEIHKRNIKTELRPGDIVFTKIGANIGDSSVLPSSYERYNFSQNVAGAKINQGKINPHYLAAYLSSRYGRFQLKRVQMLSGQGKLELTDIRNILVFNANSSQQEEVAEYYQKAEQTIVESKTSYLQAEYMLIKELGLSEVMLSDDIYFTTSFKNICDNNRMDSDYYLPKYTLILEHLKTKKLKKMEDFGQYSNTVIKTKKDEFYKYIEIGDIDPLTGEVSFSILQDCDLPANAKQKITGGELIISKVRPTRGAIAIIPDDFKENFVCSGAFSIFNISSPEREFIQVFLRSIIGKALLGRPSTGTQYPIITDNDVKGIPIPQLSNKLITVIAEKVKEAHCQRARANEYLLRAKKRIEDIIKNEAGAN